MTRAVWLVIYAAASALCLLADWLRDYAEAQVRGDDGDGEGEPQ